MIFKKKQDAAAQQAAAGEARPAGKDKVAAFFRKNWKWMVPVACVAVLGGWFILRPDRAQDANVDVSYVQTTPEKRDLYAEPGQYIQCQIAGGRQGAHQHH